MMPWLLSLSSKRNSLYLLPEMRFKYLTSKQRNGSQSKEYCWSLTDRVVTSRPHDKPRKKKDKNGTPTVPTRLEDPQNPENEAPCAGRISLGLGILVQQLLHDLKEIRDLS